METHERGERARRRRRCQRMFEEQIGEPHRFSAELDAHRRLGARSVITLVEEQIERALHGCKARAEVAVREVEQMLGTRKDLLPARDALLDRGMAAEEGARNLV